MSTERIKMVKAMEYLARHVNDESIFYGIWLSVGVADCDIEYGDLTDSVDDLEYYIEDENFKYLMKAFLKVMDCANRSGGLYCDGIVG